METTIVIDMDLDQLKQKLLTMASHAEIAVNETLRALIEWSYNLLSEKEQILLRRLSVFSGG